MLRLVGGRVGPVIRSAPHDSAAQQLEWSGAMEELAEHRRGGPDHRAGGRFVRDPEARQGLRRDVVKR